MVANYGALLLLCLEAACAVAQLHSPLPATSLMPSAAAAALSEVPVSARLRTLQQLRNSGMPPSAGTAATHQQRSPISSSPSVFAPLPASSSGSPTAGARSPQSPRSPSPPLSPPRSPPQPRLTSPASSGSTTPTPVSTQASATPALAAYEFMVTGTARFVGPAVSCRGFALAHGRSAGAVSSGAGGDVAGLVAAPAAAALAVELVAPDPGCVDAFTGLPLPYNISAPLDVAAGALTSLKLPPPPPPPLVVTPVTTLLSVGGGIQTVTAAAAGGNAVQASYGMLGVNTSGEGVAGAFAALRSEAPWSRLAGVRMLFADAAVSSLIITAVGSLAAFPAGTLPRCTTEAALVAAVYGTLADRIAASTSRTIALDSTTLFSTVVSAAAMDKCGAAPATLSSAIVKLLMTHGSVLYQTAAASLYLSNGDLGTGSELVALPLEALSTAARVSYVVQTRASGALMGLARHPEAVQEIISEWPALLEAAPVKLAEMATEIGLTPPAPAAAALRLSIRGVGGLTHCQLLVRSPYLANSTSVATDSRGMSYASGVCGPMVTVPAGCLDAALTASESATTNPLPLQALLPYQASSAVVNPAAALASAAFMAAATTEARRPRHITAADYAAVYGYWGVGLPGGPDALPADTDFVRQGWPRGGCLDARALLVNIRLLSALGPACEFVLGVVAVNSSVNSGSGGSGGLPGAFQDMDEQRQRVATALFSLAADDLAGKRLRLEDKSYLVTLMRAAVVRTHGSLAAVAAAAAPARRARLQQEPSAVQLEVALAAAASVISNGVCMVTQLDEQLLAAARAAASSGGAFNATALAVRRATQVAAVQTGAMSVALRQLAAAAAVGDAATVSRLAAQVQVSYTGAALQSKVADVDVDVGALASVADPQDRASPPPSGQSYTGTGSPAGADPATPASSGRAAPSIAAIAAITVGVSFGALLVAGIITVSVRYVRRRNAFRFDLRDVGPMPFVSYPYDGDVFGDGSLGSTIRRTPLPSELRPSFCTAAAVSLEAATPPLPSPATPRMTSSAPGSFACRRSQSLPLPSPQRLPKPITNAQEASLSLQLPKTPKAGRSGERSLQSPSEPQHQYQQPQLPSPQLPQAQPQAQPQPRSWWSRSALRRGDEPRLLFPPLHTRASGRRQSTAHPHPQLFLTHTNAVADAEQMLAEEPESCVVLAAAAAAAAAAEVQGQAQVRVRAQHWWRPPPPPPSPPGMAEQQQPQQQQWRQTQANLPSGCCPGPGTAEELRTCTGVEAGLALRQAGTDCGTPTSMATTASPGGFSSSKHTNDSPPFLSPAPSSKRPVDSPPLLSPAPSGGMMPYGSPQHGMSACLPSREALPSGGGSGPDGLPCSSGASSRSLGCAAFISVKAGADAAEPPTLRRPRDGDGDGDGGGTAEAGGGALGACGPPSLKHDASCSTSSVTGSACATASGVDRAGGSGSGSSSGSSLQRGTVAASGRDGGEIKPFGEKPAAVVQPPALASVTARAKAEAPVTENPACTLQTRSRAESSSWVPSIP